MKERSLAVAISFCHNVVDIKQGLSIILPPESQYDIPPSIIDDILGIFQERLSHKSKFLAALVSEQLAKVQSEEFKEFINSEEFREWNEEKKKNGARVHKEESKTLDALMPKELQLLIS